MGWNPVQCHIATNKEPVCLPFAVCKLPFCVISGAIIPRKPYACSVTRACLYRLPFLCAHFFGSSYVMVTGMTR